MTTIENHGSNIAATYRGYRHQALYALYRILHVKGSSTVFRPDGREDLDILDSSGNLLELVQVKSREGQLSYSSVAGFLQGACKAISEHPEIGLRLVSSGPLGPELGGALRGPGPERDEVVDKMRKEGTDSQVAHAVLDRVSAEPFDEGQAELAVTAQLAQLATGANTVVATDLLLFWLYKSSERQSSLTKDDLVSVVDGVGRFLAERTSHHAEWFTVIEPLEADVSGVNGKDELAEEYRAGVSARFEHIIAQLDISRDERIKQIRDAFQGSNVVVVKGASGQGKSTLCYRFLYESYPELHRYWVRRIRDQVHALRVAKALVSHAQGLDLPMAVLVDVHPSDTEWPELVRELSRYSLLNVLVAIREEDFKRAVSVGETFRFATVDLEFDEQEARSLYQAGEDAALQFLNFDEAWDLFGGNGPLMEFTHLLSEKQTLRDRLKNQVQRLQNEVRARSRPVSELALLRLVTVASANGARLRLRETAQKLGVVEAGSAVDSLEREYLLRRSSDGDLVEGLHPIRSSLLVELLVDPADSTIGEIAATCIELVPPKDLFVFLLNVLSGDDRSCEPVLACVKSYRPTDLTSFAAVADALLWLGARRYSEDNSAVVRDTVRTEGSAWSMVLDPTLPLEKGGPGLPVFWENLGSLVSDERKRKFQETRERLPSSASVVDLAFAWLRTAGQDLEPPSTDSDWEAAARLLFWCHYLDVGFPLMSLLQGGEFSSAMQRLPIEVLADLVSAMYTNDKQTAQVLLGPHVDALLRRYQVEAKVFAIETSRNEIDVAFVVDVFNGGSEPANESNASSCDPLHEMALRVVKLLMKLQPHFDAYGCQGYGHRVLVPITGEYDSTHKKGMARSAIPMPWVPSLNSTILSLMERPFRPEGWKEFAGAELEFRRKLVRSTSRLCDSLTVHFRRRTAVHPFKDRVLATDWGECSKSMSSSLLLPRQAVDDFGLVSESRTTGSGGDGAGNDTSLRKYVALQSASPFIQARGDFVFSLRNFFKQAPEAAARLTAFGKGRMASERRRQIDEFLDAQGLGSNVVCLSLHNLREALVRLPAFQQAFEGFFHSVVSADQLGRLHKEERAAYLKLCSLWSVYVSNPRAVEQNAPRRWGNQSLEEERKLRRVLIRRLNRNLGVGMEVRIPEMHELGQGQSRLCVFVDGEDPLRVYEGIESLVGELCSQIGKACRKRAVRHTVETHWRDILVLLTTSGKPIINLGWHAYGPAIASAALSGESHDSTFFKPKPVTEDQFSEMGLQPLGQEELRQPRKLFEQTAKLTLLVGHLAELASVPEPNEVGEEILKMHVERVGKSVEECVNECLEVCCVVHDELIALQRQASSEDDTQEMLDLLAEWLNSMKPADELEDKMHISLEMSVGWATQLEVAQGAAFLLLLHWAKCLTKSMAGQPPEVAE